jgi:16S rRNA (guanine966-N2)-methyltransferase
MILCPLGLPMLFNNKMIKNDKSTTHHNPHVTIVGGMYRGKKLKCPPSHITRPALNRSREAIFNILMHTYDLINKRVLDGFAGSGVWGIEALSRGATTITLVDQSKEAFQIINANISQLKQNHSIHSYCHDICTFKSPHIMDFIFLCPPYGLDLEDPSLLNLEQSAMDHDTLIIMEVEMNSEWKPDLNKYECVDHRRYGRNQFYFLKLKAK